MAYCLYNRTTRRGRLGDGRLCVVCASVDFDCSVFGFWDGRRVSAFPFTRVESHAWTLLTCCCPQESKMLGQLQNLGETQ